jgi:hypothetical protein
LGIYERSPNFAFDFFLGPIGMLAAEKSCLVSAHCPIEPMGGIPTLLWRHAPEDFDLLRARLFVG